MTRYDEAEPSMRVNGTWLLRKQVVLVKLEFDPTFQFVIMILQNVGRINSSVFDRNGFGSITTLQLNGDEHKLVPRSCFLDTLSLAGNQIEVVDATALHGLTNLKQLRLNNNRIRTIHPHSFTSLVWLTESDLSDDRLTRLSPRLLGSLRSVRSIRLHGNRWSCWCDAEDFVASLKGSEQSADVQVPEGYCGLRPAEPVCAGPTHTGTNSSHTGTSGSSHLVSPESSRTKPNPLTTVPSSSADGTSGAQMRRSSTMNSGTVISSLVHSKPAFTPFTVLKASRATDSASSSSPLVPDIHIFVTLVSIIVLLSLLLGGMCLLLVMHRQKL
ncbi:hypothetical protein OJAV_G00084690 [Oryzias javanicus]|uniref:LRRCT domain-containing protein n=1 Tax=Oryzias javanicus TaxID=123683 RepID=A0A3S2PR71_ORYJA|nr:hypothetical protein OJAV_G00084690 [Oryzias javanicus]